MIRKIFALGLFTFAILIVNINNRLSARTIEFAIKIMPEKNRQTPEVREAKALADAILRH